MICCLGDYCLIERLESSLPEHLQLYQNHMKQKLDVRETVYFLTDKNSPKNDPNNNDII